MNYLDLLPVDVMKIINRQVHNLQIIKEKLKEREIKKSLKKTNEKQIEDE